MAVTVRDATPADHAAIAELTVAAYREDGQLDGGHGYERTLADVATRATGGDLLVAVDDDTGSPIGSAMVVLPGSGYASIVRDGEAELRMLAVAPGAQRRGAGRALTNACLDRVRRHGCRAAVLIARDDRPVPLALYRAMGFTRIPERDFTPVPGVHLLAFRLPLEPDPR